ncbi:Crp/Fnr family transcriptional regulator [Brevundimonas goettingensis]|uniref:Winged helix-turn-helix domain-containing protein n=1 Tax=Brevundimonas goettingensis TaxID=2774190 RepID=A0A975C1Q1_9CAUL|nr:helix-turn-helix domain-containing protein [Brevundimonas goettingensis]QTC92283.1 winged helix-turn-helix domain-containing protein [Brevundimonas goettingensis]
MISDFLDSDEPGPPSVAAKGLRREAGVGPARVEAGVFIETSPAGRLARVVGPGEPIQDEGVWATDGRFRELDADPADPRQAAAVDRRVRVFKARLDCLMSHAGAARLADLLATVHDRTQDERLAITQQELGALVGLRRATVNEALQALQDRKIVRIGRGRVDICNPEGLAAAACGCESGLADPDMGS